MPSEQSASGIDHGRGTFVLVGCGAAKAEERREARNLYTSTYFQLKRRFAEAATNWIADETEAGNGWMILSAEHGLWPPRLELDPYDTTIEERRLVAVSYWPATSWKILYEYAHDPDNPDDCDSDTLYHSAHDALDAVAPDDWGCRPGAFHSSLPDRSNDIDGRVEGSDS